MSRMEDMMAAKAAGEVVRGTNLAEILARAPSDTDRGTVDAPLRQRQVRLG